jgi:hypothetical protein
MSPEETDDAGVSVANDDGDDKQHDPNARRHDPRQYVLAFVLHRAVQQWDAAHEVYRRKNRARVQEYYSHWNQNNEH